MKHTLRGRAMNNWLGSIWSTSAPGLAALQRGGVASGDARRVEAVVDQDPQRSVTEMYVSRSEEHTSELQSLMRISDAVLCLKKKKMRDSEYIRTCDTATSNHKQLVCTC